MFLIMFFFKTHFKMEITPILFRIDYCYPLAACMSYSVNTEASLDNTDDEQPKQPMKTTMILKIQQNIGI